jgi:hypothetical protein
VPETSDAGQRAREMAAEVLATVEPRSDPWAQATACEAVWHSVTQSML